MLTVRVGADAAIPHNTTEQGENGLIIHVTHLLKFVIQYGIVTPGQ